MALDCLFGGASASREKIVIGGVLSVFLSRVVRIITTTITITERSCVFIESVCEFIERASFLSVRVILCDTAIAFYLPLLVP